MLKLLLTLLLLSSCHDRCVESGGYWEDYNCHQYTHWVSQCTDYGRRGYCIQRILVPMTDTQCDHRCVMPTDKR